MSVICDVCGNIMVHKDNVYGTFCTSCNQYIKPDVLPKFIRDADRRLREHQHIIRMYLRKKILGDRNGNQVK